MQFVNDVELIVETSVGKSFQDVRTIEESKNPQKIMKLLIVLLLCLPHSYAEDLILPPFNFFQKRRNKYSETNLIKIRKKKNH